jgi:glycerol kinase
MQFQADLLNMPVLVSDLAESTAWGVAKLAAHAVGFWPSLKLIDSKRKYHPFLPQMRAIERKKYRQLWKSEIRRLLFDSHE